jgi:hypothetical protein
MNFYGVGGAFYLTLKTRHAVFRMGNEGLGPAGQAPTGFPFNPLFEIRPK